MKICENTNQPANRTRQPLPPQSIAAFRILVSEAKAVSAGRLARIMGINPHNVYKMMLPLDNRRIIRTGKIIKRSYSARHYIWARNAYMRHAGAEFDRLFLDVYEGRADWRRGVGRP
jgi:hypothetical protein